MNAQHDRNLPLTLTAATAAAPAGVTRRIEAGHALHLGRLGGDLSVLQGRVWLARDGDPGDHRIDAGQRVRLGVAEDAVIESWDSGQPVVVRWNPRRQTFFGAVLAEPLRGLAFVARFAAGGFAALARSAAASASRAQGCISGGDSMASSGALK
jgi:hypothetical protein